MARKRMIDPGFWDDLTIASLSIPARLTFLGMISNADDEGRLEADPRYIKRAVFGFDEAVTFPDVAEYLAEIERVCPNIQFYEVAGRLIASFRNWRRYQYIQKPQASRLPAPPIAVTAEHDASTLPITDHSHNVPLSVEDEHDASNGAVSPNRIEVNRIEVNRDMQQQQHDSDDYEMSIEEANEAAAALIEKFRKGPKRG